VVQDVSVLGIRCAPLVLDVTNTIRSSIDMSDEVEVINELNQDSYRKLLRLSCKDAEMAEQKLIRILKGMKSVPKHCSSGNAIVSDQILIWWVISRCTFSCSIDGRMVGYYLEFLSTRHPPISWVVVGAPFLGSWSCQFPCFREIMRIAWAKYVMSLLLPWATKWFGTYCCNLSIRDQPSWRLITTELALWIMSATAACYPCSGKGTPPVNSWESGTTYAEDSPPLVPDHELATPLLPSFSFIQHYISFSFTVHMFSYL